MQELNNLLDKIKKTRSLASDNALAKEIGVSRQRVSAWRNGDNLPDTVACATIAGLTGEPLARVLGIVGEARAISKEEKQIWRRLAASAASIVVLLAGLLPVGATQAHTRGIDSISHSTAANAYYVRINTRDKRFVPLHQAGSVARMCGLALVAVISTRACSLQLCIAPHPSAVALLENDKQSDS